jgi:hypothetical protein
VLIRKDTRELVLYLTRHREKARVCKPGRALPENMTDLALGLPDFRSEKRNFCSLSDNLLSQVARTTHNVTWNPG